MRNVKGAAVDPDSPAVSKFKSSHRRFVFCIALVAAYSLCVGLASRFVDLEPYAPCLTIGVFVVVLVALWGAFGFRCPVCGAVPKARQASLTSHEIAYSSSVALIPKQCGKCGVSFQAPGPTPEKPTDSGHAS